MMSNDMQDFERIAQTNLLREEAFGDMPAKEWTFEASMFTVPSIYKAKRYADEWDRFSREGIGLILIGDVGTEKTYAAGCIANALIDRMIPVLLVRVVDVLSHLQGSYGKDREIYYERLTRPELLILDDLGSERDTDFARECIYAVIERRLATKKPMIITTNIPLERLENPVDVGESRIYSRILEACVPILFDGEDVRKKIAAEKRKKAAAILTGKKEENEWIR